MIAEALNRLVRELTKLPSIGEKTALRMAFHIIALPRHEAQSLAQSILEVKDTITLCFYAERILLLDVRLLI